MGQLRMITRRSIMVNGAALALATPALGQSSLTVHRRLLTLDSHLDAPTNFGRTGWDIMDRHGGEVDATQLDHPRMVQGGLDGKLKVLNERRYFNDGAWRPVPLRFMACASNEVPEDGDTSVEAFYDRILVRHVVKPIEDDCNLNRVLDGDLPPMTPALMTIAEVDQAKVLARATPLHDTARIARADIRRELTAKGVRVSDRRWGQATNYCRAVAWLGGQAEVTRSTLMHLVPCLWSRPEHIPLVDECVKRHAPSWESEVRVVMTAVSEQRAVLSRVDGMGHEPALSAIGSARAALDDLDADLDAIAGRHLGADVTPSKATITQLRGELLARIVAVMQAPSKAVRR